MYSIRNNTAMFGWFTWLPFQLLADTHAHFLNQLFYLFGNGGDGVERAKGA